MLVEPIGNLSSFEVMCLRAYIAEHPEEFTKSKNPQTQKIYLLTFTRDPAVDRHLWYERLVKALSSKMFKTMRASIEHIESNIHCHALVTVECNLSRDKFTSYLKDAKNAIRALDIKKVSKDNGIGEYIAKESKVFDNLVDFENYYSKLIV